MLHTKASTCRRAPAAYIQRLLCSGKLAEHPLSKSLSLGAPGTAPRSKAAQGTHLPTGGANLTLLVKSSSPFPDSVFLGCTRTCCLGCSWTVLRAPALSPMAGFPTGRGHAPLAAGWPCPSPICQGKGTGLHTLPDLSQWFKKHFYRQGVKIPWMHLNWNRLGSTYVHCYWERCNRWWGLGGEKPLWDLPLKPAGWHPTGARSLWQGRKDVWLHQSARRRGTARCYVSICACSQSKRRSCAPRSSSC